MSDYSKWQDEEGNYKPNSWQADSENPSTINAAYFFLKEQADELTDKDINMIGWLNYQKWITNGDKYMTNSYDVLRIDYAKEHGHRSPDRFSLDEAISVAATSKRYKHVSNLKKISLFTRSYSLRPDTFSFLLLCKYPVFNLLLIPRIIVSLSMIISCMRKPGDTSGKQLSFIRAMGLDMQWTMNICSWVLTNKKWHKVFAIWYPEPEHPCNIYARKVGE